MLSSTSLWTGQKLTLTQTALSDGASGTAGITRVVKWGDGSAATTIAAGATKVSKAYAKKGKFTVSVTLTVAAGNTAKAKIVKPTLTVAAPAVAFKLSKKSVYHHGLFKVSITKVPGGTTKIVLDRRDGTLTTLKAKTQSVSVRYYHRTSTATLVAPGKITLKAILSNKNGAAAPVTVGTVTLKKDYWQPKVAFTKPAKSKATKASSWSTVRGTASDKGAGIQNSLVGLAAYRVNSSGDAWCYTTKNTWLKVDFDNENQDLSRCELTSKVSKGKWSHKIKGLKKGFILVLAAGTIDWADKESSIPTVQQALTRN